MTLSEAFAASNCYCVTRTDNGVAWVGFTDSTYSFIEGKIARVHIRDRRVYLDWQPVMKNSKLYNEFADSIY